MVAPARRSVPQPQCTDTSAFEAFAVPAAREDAPPLAELVSELDRARQVAQMALRREAA